ncbi:MAG: enoyl-CoA hydratase/isomerase family protein [Myxococcaceae bacterium]|jgi:enoyl-CoA hydratase|nr:enoyl-CoA hydratase/isomerase family protein [Myxococcaceae bacterium]MCA3014255.1 enoyl-CoA hydratase/isomerase family protein [Myxococcaceae bacterium]
MTLEFVTLAFDGPVALVTIDRPKALNALNAQVLQELDQALGLAAAHADTRALILTGEGGKAFVAGADIAEMAQYTPAQALAFSAKGHQVMARLEALPFPTIAAVNGFALGGGLELALACDLLYASEKAKLGLPEVSLAVIPGFGGTQRLMRAVGKLRARELIFTGEAIDAAKAKEIGLALEVLPHDALLPRCKEIAHTIATRGPLALSQAKRVIEAGADLPLKDANELERQAFALLFGTDDQKEGMRAFLEKRKAAFKNL